MKKTSFLSRILLFTVLSSLILGGFIGNATYQEPQQAKYPVVDPGCAGLQVVGGEVKIPFPVQQIFGVFDAIQYDLNLNWDQQSSSNYYGTNSTNPVFVYSDYSIVTNLALSDGYWVVVVLKDDMIYTLCKCYCEVPL